MCQASQCRAAHAMVRWLLHFCLHTTSIHTHYQLNDSQACNIAYRSAWMSTEAATHSDEQQPSTSAPNRPTSGKANSCMWLSTFHCSPRLYVYASDGHVLSIAHTRNTTNTAIPTSPTIPTTSQRYGTCTCPMPMPTAQSVMFEQCLSLQPPYKSCMCMLMLYGFVYSV